MIKLIIFDLDGVLVESKDIHYQTLNDAISTIAGHQYIITLNEHLSIYDGLKTNQKLDMLSKDKGLSIDLHNDIWVLKQKLTLESISQLQPDKRLIEVFKTLN